MTGANKGIGFGIVKALCQRFSGEVLLTSRDESRGLEALEKLKCEGLTPRYHQLDICDEVSIARLRDHLLDQYQGLDVLVNNAGVAYKYGSSESVERRARVTLATNYWSSKRVCEMMFPILRPGANVVNVSSSCGFLGHLTAKYTTENKPRSNSQLDKAEKLKEALASEDLLIKDLDQLIMEYESSTEDGSYLDKGWPESTYMVSKVDDLHHI